MKKISLLSAILLCGVFSVNAQVVRVWNARLDLQAVQSFGLNDWNRVEFASDRLPRASSSTDLRATVNLYFIKRVAGIFQDVGVGFMPAPRNGLSDPASQAASTMGIPYYTKEILTEDGNRTAGAHFKMTFGIFGEFSVADKLSVSPRFGVGFMTISAPTCEAVLKEHDSNMQYIALYQWFGKDKSNYDYSNVASLGYLAYRLRFAYHISPKHDFLFGLEYTWHFTRADFSETYTNYFNHNITRTINHEGNRLNMAGFSAGISF